jgi:hydroxymethylpyrimidine pyrophosphatase-like HAD family hydrolase
MIVGLDWDGTVTSAPSLFLSFAETAKEQGHKVYIVTMRYPSEDLELRRRLVQRH